MYVHLYIVYTSIYYIYTLYPIYIICLLYIHPISYIYLVPYVPYTISYICIYIFIYLGKEIQPVHPKGNQSSIFIGGTDAEVETSILWPPDGKSWLIGKDLDAGKDWRWEEKGMTEDEKVGWHHWCNRHESEQAPGVGDGQGGLVCCGSWGRKE